MAVERLILRSVLYGADKIPDKWFDKVPGGFYRNKNGELKKKSLDSGHRKRQSSIYQPRRSRDGDHYDDGYRSDGERRRRRGRRSSYDGGIDVDYYHYSGDEGRRRSKSRRRQRSVDVDRHGYDEGYGRRPRDDFYFDRRGSAAPVYPSDPDYGLRRSNAQLDKASQPSEPRVFDPGPFAAAAAAEAGAAASAPPNPRMNTAPPMSYQSPPIGRPPIPYGGDNNAYVPYGNIYSPPNQRPAPHHFSTAPPPRGPMRQNTVNQVPPPPPSMPPPEEYHPPPFARPPPAAPFPRSDGPYRGQHGFIPHDLHYGNGYDSGYDRRRYDGYDENEYPSYMESPSPPPSRMRSRSRSRPNFSQSFVSFDPHVDERQARSHRRTDSGRSKSQGRGKSKSRVREAFDPSQRGLGYGTLGAVAGGLVGSEFGKGAVPSAIGATLGALGANAFQARERYVDSYKRSDTQMPSPPQPSYRRKDDRRNSEFFQDPNFDRGADKVRRGNGYSSD